MTDSALVAKKLAEIETYLREIDDLGRADRIEEDLVQRRFIERTLQMAVQSALDTASHIVSDEKLGEPETLRAMFSLLAREGWISTDLAESLRSMAGFRNVLVHDYARVDLDILRDVALNHTDDLRAFVAAIRRRLAV